MRTGTRIGAALAGGALGVALLPAAAASAQQQTYTLGPNGLDELKLGMTKAQAEATDMISDPEQIHGCTWYGLDPKYGNQNPGGAVIISPTAGVVAISGTDHTTTPENITMGSVNNHHGSTIDQLKHAYPNLAPIGDTDFVYAAGTPEHDNLRYRFAVNTDGDHRVKDLDIETVDDGGCGLHG